MYFLILGDAIFRESILWIWFWKRFFELKQDVSEMNFRKAAVADPMRPLKFDLCMWIPLPLQITHWTMIENIARKLQNDIFQEYLLQGTILKDTFTFPLTNKKVN